MSVSLYYTAQRPTQPSPEETAAVQAIIRRYCRHFPFRETAEEFSLYEYDPAEPDTILDGSTKLPSDIEELLQAAIYWAACLSELRRAVAGAAWQVSIDDTALQWSEADGWHFPAA